MVDDDVSIDELREAVEHMHGVPATYVESVEVDERFQGAIVWQGKAITVGGAALEILKAAGRPMHATRELLPLIQERGITVTKTTLPTALRRQKSLKKIEPGVWAAKAAD